MAVHTTTSAAIRRRPRRDPDGRRETKYSRGDRGPQTHVHPLDAQLASNQPLPQREQQQLMKSWKWLTGLFFLLVIVDGTLRKWVLPNQSAALFVLKDVVLWGGFLLYALRRPPTELPRPLRSTWVPLLLGAYVYLALVQAVNPRMPNLIVSMVGIKAHLAFVPLVILMSALIVEVTERRALRFLWGYALFIVVPIAALSVYQFFQPPSAWINQYVREMGVVAAAGGHARVIATFSYIGSHTAYLTFNAFLSAGVLLAGLRWRRRDLVALGSLLLATVAIVLPMAGSRGPILIVLGGMGALIVVAETRFTGWVQFAAAVLLIGVVVVEGLGGTGLAEGWDALIERTEQAGGVEAAQERISGMLSSPLEGIQRGGLFGNGTGSAHQAAPRFVPGAFGHEWLPGGYIESSIARTMIELGMLGWLLLTTLKAVLLYFAYRTVQQARRPLELIVGATAFCLLLAKLPFPVVYNAVANAFYWGTAGTMLGVWSLQQVRRGGTRPQRDSRRRVHA